MTFPRLPRKAITGIVFIYLAGLGWLAEFFIPFSHLPHKAIIFGIVLGISELNFLIGVALLGKTYYGQLKALLLSLLAGPKNRP
jgi:hypothetical protein